MSGDRKGFLIGLLERRDGYNMQTAISAPSPIRLGRVSTSALHARSSSKLLKNISTDLKDIFMTPSRAGDRKSSDRYARFHIRPPFTPSLAGCSVGLQR